MEILTNKHKYNPNAMVDSIYQGVSPNGMTVTTVKKPSADGSRMETTRTYGAPLPRGQSGQAAVLILVGMETSMDEMNEILECHQQKKFVPRKSQGEIANMCRMLIEQRNDQVRYLRKNPSEKPKKTNTRRLLLPVGYRYAPTAVPGFQVTVKS